jgi:hypothetical protein
LTFCHTVFEDFKEFFLFFPRERRNELIIKHGDFSLDNLIHEFVVASIKSGNRDVLMQVRHPLIENGVTIPACFLN